MRLTTLLFASLLVPAAAGAHVTVWPRLSELGAYEKYTVRVPNEKRVATVRIEARFPAGVRVQSFQDVPEWKIELQRDASGAIIGAAWVGRLPPERFVEFSLIAVNPKAGADLTWTFDQFYDDGTRVQWNGVEGSKTPASVVTLNPAAPAAHHH